MSPSLLLLLGLACKDKGEADTPADDGADDTADTALEVVDVYCPGGPGCEDADGPLMVGAAKVVITPTCFEAWTDEDGDFEWDYSDEPYLDCGCDRLCTGDEGYPGPDEGEEDGKFQAVWMAGFHNARPATEVLDDLWARAIVFDQGSTRIALVMVDLVGFFRPDVLLAREALAATSADVDLLIVASTHDHEGPDTMGLWGKTESVSGVDPEYNAQVRDAIVQSVQDAVADLREVGTFQVGSVDMRTYSDQGVYNVITDLRDPVVIDETLNAALFSDGSGATIATIAHLGDHPESLADENTGLTSDFPHGLRQTLEEGVTWDAYSREGLGGTAIFVNGAVGGMMTSLRVDTVDPDGNVWDPYTYERTVTIGKVMGEMALDAIELGDVVSNPKISVATRKIEIPVENWGFQAMFLTGIIERELFDYDTEQPIDDTNVPSIETEIDLLKVGPITLLTIPGELLPELNIGGYDGSHVGSDDATLVDPENPNPPDLTQAPPSPYIQERVGGEHMWLVGLGNDELGYIVPAYDFVLDEHNPWFDEAEGDHYEETNSLGAQTAGIIDTEVDVLSDWVKEHQGG